MAQAIMSNSGSNTNKNMRMGIIYNVGVGYVQITGMYGCRYDGYNTSGSPCTVYTNGGNGINIAGAHNANTGTFRPNSSKNTTLTNSSYWKAWGAGPTIYTSSSSITLTFTFACSATANIANAKFSTTVTGIPQPYTPAISAVSTSNITRTSVNYSWSVTDSGNGSIADKYIDLFNNSNCSAEAKLQVGYDYTGSFSGLSANTTYYLRANASNGSYRGYSAVKSFTTTGNAPVYNNHYADNITRTSATVEFYGTYDNNSWLSSYYIDWGTSTSYGNKLTNTNALSNLTPNTTYYYKLTATDNWNRTGTATGSFTTSGNAPTITNFRAINISAKEAKLTWSDTYDTNAWYSTYSIEYGTTTAYGTTLNAQSQLSDLDPRTTYYVKLTLKDNWGRTSTATTSFTTLAGDATGYVKGYVDGQGVVWQRGTVYIKQERRNMLNTEVTTKTVNGVTMSYDAVNHAIVLNGTCTADNTCLTLDKQVPLVLDGDYTISFEELGGTATEKNKIRVQLQNSTTWAGIWIGCNHNTGYNIKSLENTRVNVNNIRIDAGVVLDNYTVRFQLEKGTERTEFEPYEPHWKKGRRVRKKTGGVWSESD